MDTFRARAARALDLTPRQFEIVIGCLLGDGYLMPTTCGFSFRVNHGVSQKDYVDWKYRELEALTNSPPRQCKNSYYFRTVSHPFFVKLRPLFYSGGRKILPELLYEWLTPLAFAVWIMDDGARDGAQLRINTQSFSKDENEKLVEILKAKFGIAASLNRDKDRFRLRVSASSMSIVRQLVVPHLHPSMRYKLLPVTTSENFQLRTGNSETRSIRSGNTSPPGNG